MAFIIFRILIAFQVRLPCLAKRQLQKTGLNLQIGPGKIAVLQQNVHQMARKGEERQKSHHGKNLLYGCGCLYLVEHISHHKYPEDQPL